MLEIAKCAKSYGLIDTSAPPSPTDRDAWQPLLSRAAHCLAADGKYVATPPTKSRAGQKGAANGAVSPCVYNTFVLFTRDADAGGDKTISKDAAALGQALRAEKLQLPAALGRLAGIYDLPVIPKPLADPQAPGQSIARYIIAPRFQNGAKYRDLRCVLHPSTLCAGRKTLLESII